MISHQSTGRGRRLVPVILAIVLAMTAGTAIGGHFASAVKSYTGCLNAGTVVQVAEGDAPAKTCANGHVEVHFSGGDITAITAGTGLVGGSDNGAATLALAPGYQLPQGCSTAQVAKWNGSVWECAEDDSTAYTAGTGLELNGTEFSIDRDYRLPQGCASGEAPGFGPTATSLGEWSCTPYTHAGESCPSGEFVTATTSSGFLDCAAPSAVGGSHLALSGRQASFDAGMGLPDDDEYRVVAAVDAPAGTYVVTAKGAIRTEQNITDFSSPTACALQAGGSEFDYIAFVNADLDDNVFQETFALTGVITTAEAGPVTLVCKAGIGADGISVRYGQIVALKAS